MIAQIAADICLASMHLGNVSILAIAILDHNSFVVNVNGVPQKDWVAAIFLAFIMSFVFVVLSLLFYYLSCRFNAANRRHSNEESQATDNSTERRGTEEKL